MHRALRRRSRKAIVDVIEDYQRWPLGKEPAFLLRPRVFTWTNPRWDFVMQGTAVNFWHLVFPRDYVLSSPLRQVRPLARRFGDALGRSLFRHHQLLDGLV